VSAAASRQAAGKRKHHNVDTGIVSVMLDIFQNELDTAHFGQLQEHHAELRGLRPDRVQAFIDAARRVIEVHR
jgi:hypothetical protein